MGESGVSCLCLTYGRHHLLEEAIQSFLLQDYAGDKELIVVNDHPDQLLTFDHPLVSIFNIPRRLRSLGEKRNLSVALAQYDNLVIWDDDDIFLPWRIAETMKTLEKDHFYKCPNAWVMNDGRITELGYNLYHSSSAYTRWLFEKSGGYKPMNGGEDADIEFRFQHVTPVDAEYWKHTILPKNRVYYIYRWSHGSYHTTGSDRLPEIDPVPHGTIALQPHWQSNYALLALLAAGQSKLNLGCGDCYMNGYINVDIAPSSVQRRERPPDVHDDIQKLNIPDNSADEIRLHHVFEHFQRHIAFRLLCAWNRALKSGGSLVLAVPDVHACMLEYPRAGANRQKQLIRHLWGSHEDVWATHHEGWTPETLSEAFDATGFSVSSVSKNGGTWPQFTITGRKSSEPCDEKMLSFLSHMDAGTGMLHSWMNTIRGSA